MIKVAVRRSTLAGTRLDGESGQALVEYALILGLVSVVSIALLSAVGTDIGSLLQAVTSALNSAL
jgi:Flp pilus assembly pilin Flp